MNYTIRSFVTSGIAITGAGLIVAVTPAAPPTPGVPQAESHAVVLTAAEEAAADSINLGLITIFQNPFGIGLLPIGPLVDLFGLGGTPLSGLVDFLGLGDDGVGDLLSGLLTGLGLSDDTLGGLVDNFGVGSEPLGDLLTSLLNSLGMGDETLGEFMSSDLASSNLSTVMETLLVPVLQNLLVDASGDPITLGELVNGTGLGTLTLGHLLTDLGATNTAFLSTLLGVLTPIGLGSTTDLDSMLTDIGAQDTPAATVIANIFNDSDLTQVQMNTLLTNLGLNNVTMDQLIGDLNLNITVDQALSGLGMSDTSLGDLISQLNLTMTVDDALNQLGISGSTLDALLHGIGLWDHDLFTFTLGGVSDAGAELASLF